MRSEEKGNVKEKVEAMQKKYDVSHCMCVVASRPSSLVT